MSDEEPKSQDRRAFFSTVAASGAASLLATSAPAQAAPTVAASSSVKAAGMGPPLAEVLASEQQPPAAVEPGTLGRAGGDYMVDAIKQLGVDYIATMAGSSFRGLHESIINYGGNQKPELLTCLHEEISVALSHGYAKVSGKPMAVMLHGVVGVQHGSMAIYNAWADRVPIIMLAGNALDAVKRRPGAEWYHSVLDNAAMVRDYTKWDAQPGSLEDFNEALKRGYGLAVTAPYGPVLFMLDADLQEQPIAEDMRPKPLMMIPTVPAADPAALAEAARMLVGASNPVIVADRCVRTDAGMQAMVTLAEILGAPVVDRYGRLNMPTTHELCQTERGKSLIGGADVILGLELTDPWGTINTVVDLIDRPSERVAKPSAKLITITTHDLLVKSNYADFQRYQPSDLQITADGEATLPYLIEAVQRVLTDGARTAIVARRDKLRTAYATMRQNAMKNATYGWDQSPITTGRMCAEIWAQIRDLDWALVGGDYQFRNWWPQRLWQMTKPYQFTGGSGAAGVGYCMPGAVGAALAHREHGRIPINIQGDGDLMVGSSSLWTAAHHKIPLLTVVHNNRAYHQEVMHVQRVADRHGRGVDRVKIGTTIDDPAIDYAKMAQSMGVEGIGPIVDPNDLAPALKRGIDIVKSGAPVLIDVVSQAR
jgi:acetolactate synthase-1/2/3 large subunit